MGEGIFIVERNSRVIQILHFIVVLVAETWGEGREGGREGGRKGGREEGREGGRKGGREGGREIQVGREQ